MTRKTNIQFVVGMMEHSEVGAIKQTFILEAIAFYADQTMKSEPWPENSLINQDAWKLCAQECLDALNNRSS